MAALVMGCRHAPPPRAPVRSAEFHFIEVPPAPPSPAKITFEPSPSGEVFVRARPILPLALPVYPQVALEEPGCGTTVSVHVVVDAKGGVADVRPSFFGFALPSRNAQDYFAAVERAVYQWALSTGADDSPRRGGRGRREGVPPRASVAGGRGN